MSIMEALKPESVIYRSRTSRQSQPTPHAGASQDLPATNHLFGAQDWRRRAGEWSACRGLGDGKRERGLSPHRQQTPHAQHARRPASCIEEGSGMDGWLQQLEEMQRGRSASGRGLCGYSSGSGVPVVPPLSDRTVSMPALHQHPAADRFSRHTASPSSLCSEDLQPSLTASLSTTPLGSDESLWPLEGGASSSERVCIRETPRAEYTCMSSLTPVKIGWFPVQRRLVVDHASSHTHHPHATTQNAPCQVKMKPPITPVFSKSAVKTNGFRNLDGAAERCHGRPATAPVKTCVLTGETATSSSFSSLAQFASREHRASVERGAHSPKYWQPPWRAWPERRGAPVCAESSGKKPTLPRDSCTQLPPSETLHTPPPRAKTGFSSITITSRKVTRSASLPESGGAPPGLERPRSASPAAGAMNRSAGTAAPDPLRRRAVVVKMTESRVTTSSSTRLPQAAGVHYGPRAALGAAADPKDVWWTEPVVLRRKATIVKVTEEREGYRISPVSGADPSQARRSEVRYSFTEGMQPSHYSSEPQSLSQEGTAAKRSAPKLHRSTLSLHLSPAPFTDPPGDERMDFTGRRRPVSFHAGMFSHSQPVLGSLSDLLPHGERAGLPQKVAVEPSRLTPSQVSPPVRPVCRDTALPGERSLWQSEELSEGKSLPGAVCESQPPPTLINCRDSSELTPDAILAHNAAAIIANIKLQRQRSKKTARDSSEPKTQRSLARVEAVEDAGIPRNPPQQEHDKERQDAVREGQLRHPYAEFVPFTSSVPQEASSLREALQLRRPAFISRSEARVRELQRRAQQRRQQQQQQQQQGKQKGIPTTHLPPPASHNRAARSGPNPHSDNLFKPRDRVIMGQEMQHRSRRSRSEMKRRREEERKKAESQTNRLRVDIFKKKLLDQLLHRGTD